VDCSLVKYVISCIVSIRIVDPSRRYLGAGVCGGILRVPELCWARKKALL